MISYILRTIICYEFDQNVGRMQYERHLRGEPMHAMQMNFKLHEEDYKSDPLYPGAQLLIFAASNYVGVYYRESKARDEFSPWIHRSDHDSCWKDDGVSRFISRYRDRFATLDWHDGLCNNKWYSKIQVSEEFYKKLRTITKETREGKRPREPFPTEKA